ncbi:hypothetical protein B4158_2569 [Bacillus cereus]|nr:hypothetical protein B4158_2569 [Bacillus cereus]
MLSKKSSPTYIFKNPLLYLEGDFFITNQIFFLLVFLSS